MISETSLNWFWPVCGHQSEVTDLCSVTTMTWSRKIRSFSILFKIKRIWLYILRSKSFKCDHFKNVCRDGYNICGIFKENGLKRGFQNIHRVWMKLVHYTTVVFLYGVSGSSHQKSVCIGVHYYTNNARCEGIRVANARTKVHYLVEITTLSLLLKE